MDKESTGETTDSPTVDTETTQDVETQAAESSPAANEQGEKFPPLSEVVQKALGPEPAEDDEEQVDPPATEEKDEAAEGEPDKPAETDEAGEKDKPEADAETEKGPVPYDRFQEVVAQKNNFKEKAERWDQVEQFMSTNQLSAEEVAQGFEVMSLLKNDPAKAHATLKGIMESLADQVGESMPADLARQVDDGTMDEAAARELAKARAGERLAREQLERVQRQQAMQTEQARQIQMVQAVNDWESALSKSDPDFSEKLPLIRAKLQELVMGGMPQDVATAKTYAEKAYEYANGVLTRIRPRPTPAKPTSDQSSSGRKLREKPKADAPLLDVVRHALAASTLD